VLLRGLNGEADLAAAGRARPSPASVIIKGSLHRLWLSYRSGSHLWPTIDPDLCLFPLVWPPLSLNLHTTHVVKIVVGIEKPREGVDDQFGDVFHVWNLAMAMAPAFPQDATDAEHEPLEMLRILGSDARCLSHLCFVPWIITASPRLDPWYDKVVNLYQSPRQLKNRHHESP
jgi:hypothetical protein